MKKLYQISLILIMVILLLLLQGQKNIVNASDDEEEDEGAISWDDIFQQADDFIADGQSQIDSDDTGVDEEAVSDVSDSIYNLLFGIGVVLAVIVGGVLGIKFMLASAEEKADVKNAMIPYVIGCVVIFGAFTIWKIAVSVLQKII